MLRCPFCNNRKISIYSWEFININIVSFKSSQIPEFLHENSFYSSLNGESSGSEGELIQITERERRGEKPRRLREIAAHHAVLGREIYANGNDYIFE